MPTIEIKFLPKARIIIDGDNSLVATITGVRLQPDSSPQYIIEWFDDGGAKSLLVIVDAESIAKKVLADWLTWDVGSILLPDELSALEERIIREIQTAHEFAPVH